MRLISQRPLSYWRNIQSELKDTLSIDEMKKWVENWNNLHQNGILFKNLNLSKNIQCVCLFHAFRLPSHDYRRVYCMVRHEKQRPTYSFMEYAFMASFLVKFLAANHFFDSDDANGKTEDLCTDDKAFIGSLILRNLQILQFNSHEIFDLLKSKKTGARQTVAIGAGLYTTLALLNHSCNPGIVRLVELLLILYSICFKLIFHEWHFSLVKIVTLKILPFTWLPFGIWNRVNKSLRTMGHCTARIRKRCDGRNSKISIGLTVIVKLVSKIGQFFPKWKQMKSVSSESWV